MIAIVNVSGKVKPFGPHKYEVRINREVIATFHHNREEGLEVCLQKAAKAVAANNWKKVSMFLEEFRAGQGKE